MNAISSPGPAIEYRFNAAPSQGTCPVCGSAFEAAMGMWPALAGDTQLVCGGVDCPVGEEVTRPQPCDLLFEMGELDQRTLELLRSTADAPDASASDGDGAGGGGSPDNDRAGAGTDEAGDAPTVAEIFRDVSLHRDVPDSDRNVLQLAAIDLLYCQAGDTRIERFEPRVVLRTCGEAAGEMLLSGCGEILAGP
jgi:hypothetical protein